MLVSSLIRTQVLEISRDTIVFTEKTRDWCRLPYPGHPHGCPNYGENPLCPPNVPYEPDLLEKYTQFFLFVATLNFARYKAQREQERPEWTARQVACSRYWQPSVKKGLKESIERKVHELYGKLKWSDLRHIHQNLCVRGCGSGFQAWGRKVPSMEAIGIFVLATLKRNNVPFERSPVSQVNLVALLCLPAKTFPNLTLDTYLGI